MSDTQKPGPDFSGAGPVSYTPAQSAGGGGTAAEQALASGEARLLGIAGVVSVGIGLGSPGSNVLTVGVTDAGVAARLPREIDGVPIEVTVTGPVDALRPR